MKIESADGERSDEFEATVRIDTPGEANYYRNGGIMQYVLQEPAEGLNRRKSPRRDPSKRHRVRRDVGCDGRVHGRPR